MRCNVHRGALLGHGEEYLKIVFNPEAPEELKNIQSFVEELRAKGSKGTGGAIYDWGATITIWLKE